MLFPALGCRQGWRMSCPLHIYILEGGRNIGKSSPYIFRCRSMWHFLMVMTIYPVLSRKLISLMETVGNWNVNSWSPLLPPPPPTPSSNPISKLDCHHIYMIRVWTGFQRRFTMSSLPTSWLLPVSRGAVSRLELQDHGEKRGVWKDLCFCKNYVITSNFKCRIIPTLKYNDLDIDSNYI